MIKKERIQILIDEFLSEHEDVFCIKAGIGPNNQIKVVIDSDQGANVQTCIDLSRHIEFSLDREIEDFALEISSFDLNDGFTVPRQYTKHLDKPIAILDLNGRKIRGTLLEFNEDENIVIERELTKKQIKEGIDTRLELNFDSIREVKAQIFFKK